MGDRGQIKIGKVYLYTHWGACELIQNLKDALAKRWRWDDHEYLTRIIYDEMVGDMFGTETGYGIGTEKHGDIWRFIEVTEDNRVIVEDYGVREFEGTFEEFLKWESKKEKE